MAKPSYIMKCNRCGEKVICPDCEEVESDKFHYHIYKQQPLNAKERRYLDSIKGSRGFLGGGWWYEEENFDNVIKGRFTAHDAGGALAGLTQKGKNKAMVKSIKEKLLPFYKGRKD